MNICPNCGYHHAAEDYASEIAGVDLTRMERDIVLRLSQAQGSYVRTGDLVDFIYGDDEDGGPMCADRVVRVAIWKARRAISGVGWTIAARRHLGYRLVRLS